MRNTPDIRLSRQEQWERLIPVIEPVKKSRDADFLLNKLIEITGLHQFTIREFQDQLNNFQVHWRHWR